MPSIYKTASQISFNGPVVIQLTLTAGIQFTDAASVDTKLVTEHGIWKYPAQAQGGRISMPTPESGRGRMCRLAALYVKFGASTNWTLSIVGIDNTVTRPANASGTPYPSSDKLLYLEPAIVVDSGTAVTSLAKSYDNLFLMPGQDMVLTTTAASSPTARFYFLPVPTSI